MTETFESIKKRKMKDLEHEPEIPDGEPNKDSEILYEVYFVNCA